MGTMAIVPPALATIAMKCSGASDPSIEVQDERIFNTVSDEELLIHDVATAFDLTTFAVSALVPIESSIASAPGPVFWPCILATIACIPLVFLLNFKQFYGVLATGLGWLAGLLVPATVALAITAVEAGDESSGNVSPAVALGAVQAVRPTLLDDYFEKATSSNALVPSTGIVLHSTTARPRRSRRGGVRAECSSFPTRRLPT